MYVCDGGAQALVMCLLGLAQVTGEGVTSLGHPVFRSVNTARAS